MQYDVIVVGAGVEGSSTAYQLIKNGVRRVLLLEQFHALHARGSSCGGSRCTRQVDLRELSRMVTLSIDMFAELQRENGKQLYRPIDVLSFNSGSDHVLNQTIRRLNRDGVPNTVISAKEISQRYCSRLCVPEDYIGLIEQGMKLLNMAAIMSLFQELFVGGGGVLLDNHCVTDIVPGDRVIVRTNKGDFSSQKVVITAGAWAPKLISKLGVTLPIKILRAEVLYWKVDNPDDFKPEVFPWVIYERGKEHCFVFPEFEYPGMIKIYHRTYRDIEIDDRDEEGAGPESVEKVVQFIRTYLRGVATTPAIFEPCVYSMTDDRLPIIDRVPAHHNIVFAAGMSGRGAMISPAVGLLLTEMTLDKPLSFDLTTFRVSRFLKPKL